MVFHITVSLQELFTFAFLIPGLNCDMQGVITTSVRILAARLGKTQKQDI